MYATISLIRERLRQNLHWLVAVCGACHTILLNDDDLFHNNDFLRNQTSKTLTQKEKRPVPMFF